MEWIVTKAMREDAGAKGEKEKVCVKTDKVRWLQVPKIAQTL
jgi:hypothetical protein